MLARLAPFAVLVLLAAGAWLLELAWHVEHWRWLLRRTPPSRVRSAAMGCVVLRGTVRLAGPARTSPVSRRPAVCWQVCGGTLRLPLRWDGASSAEPFWLEDPTGRVLVDPRGCRFELPVQTDVWEDGSPVFERMVGVGDEIVLLGELAPDPDARDDHGEPTARGGVVRRPRHGELVICTASQWEAAVESSGAWMPLVSGSFLLFFGAVLVAPRGVLGHPVRTLGSALLITVATLAAGALLARCVRAVRAAIYFSDGVDGVIMASIVSVVLVMWWIGGLAGFLPFPFH